MLARVGSVFGLDARLVSTLLGSDRSLVDMASALQAAGESSAGIATLGWVGCRCLVSLLAVFRRMSMAKMQMAKFRVR